MRYLLLAIIFVGVSCKDLSATQVSIIKKGTGTGLIYNATSHEPGIMCGSTCSYDFLAGAQVRFISIGDPVVWTGDCNPSGVIHNIGTTAKSCTATYTASNMASTSLTDPAWVLSSDATINNGVLTMQANPNRLVKATLDIQVTQDMLNTKLYLIADVKMNDIVTPSNYILAPSIGFGDITSGTISNNKKHLYLDGTKTTWSKSGVVNRFGSDVTTIRITIMLQNVTSGTFSIKNLKLTRTQPSYENIFPFPVPATVDGSINVNTKNMTRFNDELLGLSPYLGEYNTSPLNYDDQSIKDLTASLNIPTLRFPGGAHSNWYDWKTDNFIDPIPAGTHMNPGFITHLQDRIHNNKTFKFDDYASVLNNNNISAILTFNILNDTPEESADRLSDRLSKLNSLKWVEMGNENYFYNQRYGNVNAQNQATAAQQYVTAATNHINAMKKVNSEVKYGVNIHQANDEWANALAEDRSFFDFITPHLYINWPFNASHLDFNNAKKALTSYGFAKDKLNGWHQQFPNKPMVISEWGSISHDNDMMGNTLLALSTADIFFAMIEEPNIEAAQYYTYLSGYPMGTHRTISPNNTIVRTPVSYTYTFLQDTLRGASILKSTSQSTNMTTNSPFIRSVAAVHSGSEIKLFVLNKAPIRAKFNISLDGTRYTGAYTMKSYSESDIYMRKIYTDSKNPVVISNGSNQVTLPAYSMSVITIQTTSNTKADVDANSNINYTDAMLTLRNSVGLAMRNTKWKASATTGDVNCNGASNSVDAMLILRDVRGLSMGGTGWCAN